MMSNLSRTGAARGRRGVALIVSMSVLAILTILVMGLAASQSVARHARVRGGSERQARVLARAALDAALATLAARPEGAAAEIETEAGPFVLKEGSFGFSLSPAPGDEQAVYAGKFLRRRPGDMLASITARSNVGGYSMEVQQTYLVNPDPVLGRRLLLSEKIASARPALAPGGETASPEGTSEK